MYRRYQSSRQRPVRLFDPSFFIKTNTQAPKIKPQIIKHKFSDFPVHPQLKHNIKRLGYTIPTPIQDQVIPLILKKQDVVGIANTGTGKTAAFAIPIINQLVTDRFQKVLIITPTRELADQIQAEFASLSQNFNLISVLCIGGINIKSQLKRLKNHPQIIIGTPGRLKDLTQRRKLPLMDCNTVVLDEVDRMLDMGFIQDIKFLINHLPNSRQSLFFSATIDRKTDEIMRIFLHQPVIIKVASKPVTSNVEQTIIRLKGRNKIDVLSHLLTKPGFNKVLIFGRTKWGMEKILKALKQYRIHALTIHGNKTQNQRQRALNQFKNGQVKVLLATDVASRGLDINQVSHVINYDLPQTKEDYIHRIGRTGRADKKGMAISLIP